MRRNDASYKRDDASEEDRLQENFTLGAPLPPGPIFERKAYGSFPGGIVEKPPMVHKEYSSDDTRQMGTAAYTCIANSLKGKTQAAHP